jgi:pilus assembly protein CpaB
MWKGKAPLIVAGVLGLAAAMLAYKAVDRAQTKAQEGWVQVPVLVVNQDVMEGSQVSYDSVARSTMPSRFVTPSVVTPEHFDKIAGQRFMVPLQRGDLIMWNHFRSEDTFERLSGIVNQPGRAISLDFTGARGVAGWVRPADRVDILGTFVDPKDGQMISVTLMENVVVLATDKTTGASPRPAGLRARDQDYSTVTLMVLPEEAEMLTLAAELGSLRLTLRNPETLGTMEVRNRTTLDYVLTGERRKEMGAKRTKLIDVLRPTMDASGPR